MKYIDLFEEFKIKPRAVDVPVYSTGQRPVNIDNQKVIRKQDVIVATDDTIKQIVIDEIKRLGKDADLNHINVSQVTDMHCLFMDTDFQGDISQWDVSNVTDMSEMFENCSNFNCDLSSWNVSKVEYMDSMFDGCENFNSDISAWNVRNVINMNNMFYECSNFNQDLSGWDVGSVEYTHNMFKKCPIKDEFKPKFK